jgi:hypothetical protein
VNRAVEIQVTSVGRLIARELLSEEEMRQMFALFVEHFEGVTFAQFRHDLEAKNWVILLESDDRLVGFTTLLVYETSVEGEICSVVYSGDTIVSPEAWSAATLPRTWIESVARLRTCYPRGRYFWLLITSGFRTYRFLPLFWREFFPRFDLETPPHWKRLMDFLASERFGRSYDPATGVVRFEVPQILGGPLSTIPAGRQSDPHVAFFLSRNPGHRAGDELVCLAELSPQNLTSAGRRMANEVPQW